MSKGKGTIGSGKEFDGYLTKKQSQLDSNGEVIRAATRRGALFESRDVRYP